MFSSKFRWATPIVVVLSASFLASCGLPGVGPTKKQIFAGSVQREGDAFVVAVNDRVTRTTAVVPALGFSDSLKNAGIQSADIIRPGDTLGLTIWENVDDGLLAGEASNATALESVQVDGSGFIFVPYAGRIKAAGNTPEAIRRIITQQLEDQTPDPQVEVRRTAGDGATVSILGSAGVQGIFPITRPARTLGTMLASAGGVGTSPEIAQITLTRGNHSETIWFQDLYDHPKLDIALRDGDRILVEADQRSFTALGAAGSQTRLTFDTRTLSLVEALAQLGGLSASTADPTGVFVFRNEPAEIANAVLGRSDLVGAQRMIYVTDLTEPNGLFMARDFLIRDGDLIYVTEAPIVQWNRTIASITGTLGGAQGLTTAATGGTLGE
ncbi:polysaccharide biosynthesis/export family protein [uncultured Marivita sp.]|uniref:polysaccharide biosynthesis/export family protein n=1 Tax=uncultured Marivita sp. TaxID=888080 RepID=UPI0026397750|nr:polysaccharide biosynthesis/export family protein [uncultured Marivita sp.]